VRRGVIARFAAVQSAERVLALLIPLDVAHDSGMISPTIPG